MKMTWLLALRCQLMAAECVAYGILQSSLVAQAPMAVFRWNPFEDGTFYGEHGGTVVGNGWIAALPSWPGHAELG